MYVYNKLIPVSVVKLDKERELGNFMASVI